MNPQVRTGVTHLGTALGGAIAAISFMSSHSVDLYAIVDQVNVVIKAITQLVAIVTPFVTAAYGIYRTTTKARLEDLAKNPDIKGIVTTQAIAASIPSAKVMSTAAELPKEAQ